MDLIETELSNRCDTPSVGKDVGPVAKAPFKPQGPYPDNELPSKDGAGLGIEFVSFDENIHSIYDDLAEWQGGY